jgi:hypothetical protein
VSCKGAAPTAVLYGVLSMQKHCAVNWLPVDRERGWLGVIAVSTHQA